MKLDTQIIITILLRLGKKYKKIARGVFNLYNRYFKQGYTIIKKNVHLHLFENNLASMGHNSLIIQTMSNVGKIEVKAVLLNPPKKSDKTLKFEGNSTKSTASILSKILKNNINTIKKYKESIVHNRTERFRSIVDKENDFLRNLKQRMIHLADESVWEEATSGLALKRRQQCE